MDPCELTSKCTISPAEELEKKARRIAGCSIRATVTTGNSVVLFTMLLLQEILEQLAEDPLANLNNIITIANSISGLNSSIQIDP